MLVSPKLKKIFVHIPKTGGTSIKQAMRDNDKGWYSLGNVHDGLHEYMNIHPVKTTKYEDYDMFAVVRNCWDLVVSLYRFRQQTKNIEISFDEWLMRGNLTERKSTFPKQLPYICFPNINQKTNVVIKYFKYEEGFKQIEDYLQLKINYNIHNYGKYNSKDYFSKQSFDYLNELCKEDIDYFNFKF